MVYLVIKTDTAN